MAAEPAKPLHHVIRRFEKLGGIVLALGQHSDFDAFAEWGGRTREFPIIAIALSRSPDRVRMNLAHELGHLVLHRDVLISEHQAEAEAFAFAAELLMPAAGITRDLSSIPINIHTLLEVKKKWSVSVQAIARRARDLSIISERRYRSLNTEINRLGWRFEEPGSKVLNAERPRAVRKMAEVAFGTPLPYMEMSEALHVPAVQLKEFFERYAEDAGERSKPAKSPGVLGVLPNPSLVH